MSWNLGTDKIRTHICRTPEEVLNIVAELDHCGSAEFEREFYDEKTHVRELKAALVGGAMLTFQWSLATIPATGVSRRVNGQHSSRIFRELSTEEWQQVQFPVVIYWEEYVCDTEFDMANVFEQFDQPWRKRTPEDYVGFHLAMHPDLREPIGRHLALHLTGGMKWYFEKLQKRSYTALESHHFLHVPSHHSFFAYCGGTLSKNKTHEMLHKAVIGAIFHTMRYDTEQVRAFWKQIARGMPENPEGSPQFKLAEFLEHVDEKDWEWPKTMQRQWHGAQKKPSDLDIFATCLYACEAALQGTQIRDVFIAAKRRSVKDLCDIYFPLNQLDLLEQDALSNDENLPAA